MFLDSKPDFVVLDTEPVVSMPDPDLEAHNVSECGVGTLIGRLRVFECRSNQ
jgi:hypothetical protein